MTGMRSLLSSPRGCRFQIGSGGACVNRSAAVHTGGCFLGALLLALTLVPARAAEPKRVLVIHSFGSAAPPFTTHSIAFETELVQKMDARVDLDEVSLDMARYADSDM